MSVINRMLTDLERRGAPGARGQRRAGGPAAVDSSRRWPQRLSRIAPAAILAALVLVAAALWWQQWPRMLALFEGAVEEPAAADSGNAGETVDKTPVPTVRRFGFEHDDETVRLVVAFDRPLTEAPGYGRSGDRVGLQLPARWDRDELPAPPDGQSVYRSAVVDKRGDDAIRIGMRVDPDARFDLALDGDRLTLTGRVPDQSEGDDPGRRSASDQSVAALDVDAANEATDNATDSARPVDSGGNGAPASGDGAEKSDTATEEEPGTKAAQTASREDVTGDTDSRAGDGEDPATPQAEAAPDTADGNGSTQPTVDRVRKSEPSVAPEERARRLEAKAREALDDGDIAAARDRLTRALEFDADRHSARDLLVGLSLRTGDAETARNLLAEGVARAPERGAYAKPFARLLVDAGDLERALRVLRRAAPAADRDAGYHGLTAAVAQRLKRHDLAASEYTRALEIDSSRGVWWMGLGISLRATDHPEEALAAFREARASGDLNERLDRWVQQRIDALASARE